MKTKQLEKYYICDLQGRIQMKKCQECWQLMKSQKLLPARSRAECVELHVRLRKRLG